MEGTKSEEKTPAFKAKNPAAKRKRRHKPKDFPKRPLSAYNVFFKETRAEILASKQGAKDGVDFQSMAKEIAARWRKLEPKEKERVEGLAKEDMTRYRDEVKAYEEEMVRRNRKEREEFTSLQQDTTNPTPSALQSSDLTASLRNLPTTSALAGLNMAGMNVDRGSLDQTLGYGGLGLSALRSRELLQIQLLEELRAVEARTLQVRQMQQAAAESLPSSYQSPQASLLQSLGGNGNILYGNALPLGLGSAYSSALALGRDPANLLVPASIPQEVLLHEIARLRQAGTDLSGLGGAPPEL